MAAVTTYRILDRDAPRRAVDRPVGRIASAVTRSAQGRTPIRTGRLRAAWRTIRDDNARYHVINDVPYARFVEFGTRNTPAQPMLGPAVLQARSRVSR
jgi:HK97 gp10 family phage protein